MPLKSPKKNKLALAKEKHDSTKQLLSQAREAKKAEIEKSKQLALDNKGLTKELHDAREQFRIC